MPSGAAAAILGCAAYKPDRRAAVAQAQDCKSSDRYPPRKGWVKREQGACMETHKALAAPATVSECGLFKVVREDGQPLLLQRDAIGIASGVGR